jgi:RNA recognition motif-containing protein
LFLNHVFKKNKQLKIIVMNIYVGNLDFKVNENDLKEIFEEYGTVSTSNIIIDKYSGKSKGFGFVTMDNDSEASKAIKELNGATLENREMVVNEAKPKKSNY